MIGFAAILSHFIRVMVTNKEQSCLVNIIKKEIRPSERTTYAMKALRVMYYPAYYYKLMERMNLMHYGVNRYTDDLAQSVSKSYPLIKTH